MKINNEKLVGYILLIVGLCIMIYAIATAISVFTGSGGIPVKILEEKTTQGTSGGTTSPNFGDVMTPLFPMFNALIWLAIAFFLVAAGGRIVRLGIQMMKASLPDIKIVKEKEIKEISEEVAKKREKEESGKTK
jgi:flagellar basal body-associated protein FliL